MNFEEKIDLYIKSQKSLHLYKKTQQAFKDVFLKMTEKEFEFLTSNLIIVSLHEEAAAQVMHFEPTKKKFQVLQLTIKKSYTKDDLRFIIAHELGHVLQDRNWQVADGEKLEEDADKKAKSWGFKRETPLDPSRFGNLNNY